MAEIRLPGKIEVIVAVLGKGLEESLQRMRIRLPLVHVVPFASYCFAAGDAGTETTGLTTACRTFQVQHISNLYDKQDLRNAYGKLNNDKLYSRKNRWCMALYPTTESNPSQCNRQR